MPENFEQETKVEIVGIKYRLDNAETQIARITSYIESEVGLARNDINRVETKLFGKDEDGEYGGRIGQIRREQMTIRLRMAYAAGGFGALILIFEILKFFG